MTGAGRPPDTIDPVDRIFRRCRTIAVVGLSPNPQRASFDVSRYMQAAGYRIIPVNPNATEVLGEKAYASLLDAAKAEKIDLVNCFRRSEDIPPIAEDALAIGAPALWMQLGISHAETAAKLRAAGLTVVEDRCLKIEHRMAKARGSI
jgi:uncharacterized protein